jgi:transposase-like protein
MLTAYNPVIIEVNNMHDMTTKRNVLVEIVKTRINGHAPVCAIAKQFDVPHATVSQWHLRLNQGKETELLSDEEISEIEIMAKSDWTEAVQKTRSLALDNMVQVHEKMSDTLKDDGNGSFSARDAQSVSMAVKEITKSAFDVYGAPIGTKHVEMSVNGKVAIENTVRIVELPAKREVEIPSTAEIIE